jgi:hypothetical protein
VHFDNGVYAGWVGGGQVVAVERRMRVFEDFGRSEKFHAQLTSAGATMLSEG